MELEQARKRAEELRVIIEKNNRLYYDHDAPELEDFEYDALNRELKQIEARQQAPDHPILWNVPETNYLKFYLFQVV